MSYTFIDYLVAFACSVISSMGLGGGGLLILYLISIKGFEQLSAQGINLFFFIPCSALSIIIYIKKGLIKPGKLLPMLAGSLTGALAGSFFIQRVSPGTLKLLFAVFLVVSGLALIFYKDKKDDNNIV